MVWVYKEDGTRQCGEGTEVPLNVMQNELEKIIGSDNIISAEKRTIPLFYPQICGGRNGSANAYKITEDGSKLLFDGFVGNGGFQLWIWENPTVGSMTSEDPEVPFPLGEAIKAATDNSGAASVLHGLMSHIASVGQHPTLIRELVGRKCRYYHTGDNLTLDFRPNRTNIEVNGQKEIVRIWFG